MKRFSKVHAVRAWVADVHRRGESVGFVPTMGALHQGHLSLVRAAQEKSDRVIVSIFVNPTQFGPREDFQNYPRNVQGDLRLLGQRGIDAIFIPTVAEMVPRGFQTIVHVGTLAHKLCGPFRPGHFDGVATIVLKLFEIVQPDVAIFGRKDYQQQLIIKQMVRDFCLPVRVIDMPTVRESDGLAMSSRNRYLRPAERLSAPLIYQGLCEGKSMIRNGEKAAKNVRQTIARSLRQIPHSKIDYISIVDPQTLEEKVRITGKILLATAIWIGKTRLIDNFLV